VTDREPQIPPAARSVLERFYNRGWWEGFIIGVVMTVAAWAVSLALR